MCLSEKEVKSYEKCPDLSPTAPNNEEQASDKEERMPRGGFVTRHPLVGRSFPLSADA